MCHNYTFKGGFYCYFNVLIKPHLSFKLLNTTTVLTHWSYQVKCLKELYLGYLCPLKILF